MKLKKIGLITLVIVLISIPVLAAGNNSNSSKQEPKIAAVLNGKNITVNEVDQFANLQQMVMQFYQVNNQFTQLLFSTEAGKNLINEYRKVKLNSLIREKLLEKEAKDRNITLSEKKKDEVFNQQMARIKSQNKLNDEQLAQALKQQGYQSLDEFKKVFFKNNGGPLLITELQKQIFKDITVKDSEISNFYNENQDQFKHDAQIRASHILVKTREKAEEVLKKINAGSKFADMAKQYSTGPSASRGGDLGYFSRGSMVAAFEDAAFALKVGQVSQPVKTQYGYHIIKVVDKKEAGVTPLKDVKDKIKNALLNKNKQKVWTDFVQKLEDKAEIEIKL